MNWINIAGILGIVFFVFFLGWFICHPISRDRVLVKFGWNYFVLVGLIMASSTCVLAWFISHYGLTSIDPNNNPFLIALQYCLKIREAKDKIDDQYLNIGSFVIIMLFQIVVFEGLVLAAIVGWTSRRTKRVQKGQVRYKWSCNLNGRLPWLFDKIGYLFALLNICKLSKMSKEDFRMLWKKLINCKRYNFAVVIGANEVAPSVIKNLLKHEDEKKNSLNYAHEKENQYVVLQTCSDIEEVRQTLKAYLTEDEYSRVIIYSDIRYSYEGLKALHLDGASEIYVLGENTAIDGGETYHDTMNMRCVNMIADELIKKHNKENDYNKLINLEKSLKAEEQKEKETRDKAKIDELKESMGRKMKGAALKMCV